ncbi:MAG: metallophosphoesterase [Microthrixaceae bacterium]
MKPTTCAPNPSACAAAAAIDEATAWGAQHLFVKGDLVDRSTPATWALAGRLLSRCELPTTLMAGNHEHNRESLIDPLVGAAAIGVEVVDGARRVDLPGLSVLCLDTMRPGVHEGRITQPVARAATELAAGAPAPVMVLTHHPVERFDRAWSYPPGVPRHQGEALLTAIGGQCELLLASAGHTHSHRRRTIAGVLTTEVGSPKDYPGVWAGYTVHEGGVRQVIRRVDAAHIGAWLHHTRLAVGGVWGRWSPGRLPDRSLQVRRAPHPFTTQGREIG